MCALCLTRQRGIASRETGRILRGLWQHVIRDNQFHTNTGFHLLLIQQLGCTAWFRSTHWKRHTSCHPSTVSCVVTFRYREVSCHSPHSLLSQSKIVEPTRCTRPCSPTESPSTCSSAVKLYRSSSRGRHFEVVGTREKTTSNGLPLPPHSAADMLHDPVAAATLAHSLPDQSMSSYGPDRSGLSDGSRELCLIQITVEHFVRLAIFQSFV